MNKWTIYNLGLWQGGLIRFYATFVLNQSAVLLLNFGVKKLLRSDVETANPLNYFIKGPTK